METEKTAKRQPKQRTIESIGLINLKAGQFFYSHKRDKDITAIASYYNTKIRTERLFTINPKTGKTEKITKVIIA